MIRGARGLLGSRHKEVGRERRLRCEKGTPRAWRLVMSLILGNLGNPGKWFGTGFGGQIWRFGGRGSGYGHEFGCLLRGWFGVLRNKANFLRGGLDGGLIFFLA